MKKIYYIFLTLILIISIPILKSINKVNYIGKESQVLEKGYDYFTVPISDINKLINNNIYGYVYFGRDTCSICLNFNTFLEKEYIKNKDLIIYKFDTDYWRDNEKFQKVLDQYNISEIPTIIKINKDKTYNTKKFNIESKEEMQLDLHEFLNS